VGKKAPKKGYREDGRRNQALERSRKLTKRVKTFTGSSGTCATSSSLDAASMLLSNEPDLEDILEDEAVDERAVATEGAERGGDAMRDVMDASCCGGLSSGASVAASWKVNVRNLKEKRVSVYVESKRILRFWTEIKSTVIKDILL
jgi:hypothetical protein